MTCYLSHVVDVVKFVSGLDKVTVVDGAKAAVVVPVNVSGLLAGALLSVVVVAGASEAVGWPRDANPERVLGVDDVDVAVVAAGPAGLLSPNPPKERVGTAAAAGAEVGAGATAAAGAPRPKDNAGAGADAVVVAVAGDPKENPVPGVAVRLKAGGAAPGTAGVEAGAPNENPPAGFAIKKRNAGSKICVPNTRNTT